MEAAISTVSPGTGRPNDSKVRRTNSSSIAHWLCCSTNVKTDADGTLKYP